MFKHALSALAGALLAILVIAPAGYQLNKRLAPPSAVVDLYDIMNKNAEEIQRGTGTAEQKTQQAAVFASKLNGEVEALGKECGCTLFVKAAVLANTLPDMTARLQQRMGK